MVCIQDGQGSANAGMIERAKACALSLNAWVGAGLPRNGAGRDYLSIGEDTVPQSQDDFLTILRRANIARQEEWDPNCVLKTLEFKGNEMAGEVGEACNVIKKLVKEKHGLPGKRATVDDLAEELADVIICADLIAAELEINLADAIRQKFNSKSRELGFTTIVP
jgi:NTP pyrophosphatase (non-canonical NTP hydrolase)